MARKRINDSIASSIFHTVDAGASSAKPMICGRNSEGVRDQAATSNRKRTRDIIDKATLSVRCLVTYELTPEQCAELQQEGIQYYHRYLSLFQINDFEGVVRDTQRNLDLFTFVSEHTDREEFSWSLQQFRPYVLMMNTRAKASILLG